MLLEAVHVMLKFARRLLFWRSSFRSVFHGASLRYQDFFLNVHIRKSSPSRAVPAPSPSIHANDSLAIVLQGPFVVEEKFTENSWRWYADCYPQAIKIFSTCDNVSSKRRRIAEELGWEIVQNDPPNDSGPANINFQLVTSRAGLARAKQRGAAFALKTRSDQRIYRPDFLRLLFLFHSLFPSDKGIGLQRERLVVVSHNSFIFPKPRLSDFLMFGDIDDMLLYWPSPGKLRVGVREQFPQSNFVDVPEELLLDRFLIAVGRKKFLTAPELLEEIAQRFIVIDGSALQLFWPKYSSVEERWSSGVSQESTNLDFSEWLALRSSQGLQSFEAFIGITASAKEDSPEAKAPYHDWRWARRVGQIFRGA